MTITLGGAPQDLCVNLVADSPFAVALIRHAAPNDDTEVVWDAVPELTFEGSSTWTASIVGAVAQFEATTAQVNEVIATCAARAVSLSVGSVPWARGVVEVYS